MWILIIFFGYRGGIGVVEFNNEQACWQARTQIASSVDPRYAGPVDLKSMACVRKGYLNEK